MLSLSKHVIASIAQESFVYVEVGTSFAKLRMPQ